MGIRLLFPNVLLISCIRNVEVEVEEVEEVEEVKEVEATSFKKAVKSFQGSSKAKMVTIEWTTKGGEEFVKEQKLPFGRKKKLGR